MICRQQKKHVNHNTKKKINTISRDSHFVLFNNIFLFLFYKSKAGLKLHIYYYVYIVHDFYMFT